MNKRGKTLLSLAALCVICGAFIWLNATSLVGVRSQTKEPDNYRDPYVQIDQRAKAVNGADEAAIRELANAVFRAPSLGTVPDTFARPFEQRVVRSEISYRKGISAGVSEERIVWLIDQLANEFGAPSYARTSPEEIRELRLIISRSIPNFIPHQSLSAESDPDLAFGFTIRPSMSPLEAVYVTRTLIGYKLEIEAYLLSPSEKAGVRKTLQSLRKEFNLTPLESSFVMQDLIHQELNKDQAPQSVEEIVNSARRLSAELQLKQSHSVLIAGHSSPRVEAMNAVRLKANALSVSDALQLAHRLLDGLGIER